jgi:hypothetical protein
MTTNATTTGNIWEDRAQYSEGRRWPNDAKLWRAAGARIRELEAQVESLQNKWASRPLSSEDQARRIEELEAQLGQWRQRGSIVGVIIRDDEGKDWKWDGQDWSAVTASETSAKHEIAQGETGWVWRQSCQCERCRKIYEQFAADQEMQEQQSAINRPERGADDAKTR